MKPSLGRIVIYRSRTGRYSVPAIVAATEESLDPAGVEAGHVPPLTGDEHVHLVVFTPGEPGLRVAADDFVVDPEHRVSENVAGTYQEFDVPQDEEVPEALAPRYVNDTQAPGTWRWPPRA